MSHSLREAHSIQRLDPVGTAAVQLLHLKPEIKKPTLSLLCKTDEKKIALRLLRETDEKVTFVNGSTASAGDCINDSINRHVFNIPDGFYKEETLKFNF